MPIYPSYPSTPYTGDLPSMTAMGPVDLLPSSTTAPHFNRRLHRPYGRHLAGAPSGNGSLGAEQHSRRIRVESDMADAHMGKLGYDPARRLLVGHIQPDAVSELDDMTEQDDVQGNGVFDPASTEPNVYPDSGVFAGRWNLPGYLAREKSFSPSEILDATTGRPVYYVPGGAVSTDSVAQIAFLERGAYQQPNPIIQAQSDYPTADEGIANVMVGRRPIAPGIDQAFAGVGSAITRREAVRRRSLGVPQEATGIAASSALPLLAVAAVAAVAGYYLAQGKKR